MYPELSSTGVNPAGAGIVDVDVSVATLVEVSVIVTYQIANDHQHAVNKRISPQDDQSVCSHYTNRRSNDGLTVSVPGGRVLVLVITDVRVKVVVVAGNVIVDVLRGRAPFFAPFHPLTVQQLSPFPSAATETTAARTERAKALNHIMRDALTLPTNSRFTFTVQTVQSKVTAMSGYYTT